ncbi:MAG: hypothetical protein IPH95_01455 [Candidatus Promineofilum sp.]|mgnify:CR=1 FL=1|nr:hypothetical protein [Promineifilum sp.]
MTTHTDDKISRAAETAVDKAHVAADQAGRKVSETAGVVKEQAKRTVSQVSEQAKTNVSSRMGDVASELGSVAEAVRQTSEDLGSQDQPGIARYGNRIADQIESVSTYLNDRGVEDVLMDVEGVARRQPALFLGGAFTLGLLVGRFLRSSGQQMSYQDGGFRGYQDYPSGGYQGGSYQSGGYQGSGSSYSGSNYQSSGRQTSGRPSVEMGAETGANEPSYRQGPSVYNTSNQEEFGDNPTAYPTGLAEE